MRRVVAGILCLLAGCEAGVDGPSPGGDKEDRAGASAADRGAIAIGTSRRARFTAPGQTHAFQLELAAGAAIRLYTMPRGEHEDTLKTTLKLHGPTAAGAALPREPLATADGWFGIDATVAAAGTYVILVGTATRSMVGTYDLYASCENRACHPRPVALRAVEPPAALRAVAEAVECEDISWCSAEVGAFAYDGTTDAPALMEAIVASLTREDAEWATLEPRADAGALGAEERVSADGLVAAARELGGDGDLEAFHVDGHVQIPVGDYGTDGWGEELYVLHFPATRTAVALYVRK